MKQRRPNRTSRVQRAGTVPSIGLLLVAQLVGCDAGSPGEPYAHQAPPAGFAVSGPTGALELAGPAAGPVYVSASPGTFPDGASMTVTNLTTGESVSARISDGGVDPILISAAPDDELEVIVHNRDGTSAAYRVLTPPRKRPRVVRTRPPRDATDVVLNAVVVVVFSEPVDETTITRETVKLWLNGEPVDGSLVRGPDGLRAEFTPSQLLAPQTAYTLVIGAGIRDLDGDPLEEQVEVKFTTGTDLGPEGVIAFRRHGATEATSSIYTINADGTDLSLLVEDGLSPAWSPDGERIAFARSIENNLKIFVMNLDDGSLLQVSNGNHLGPSWSPDGSKIAFYGNQSVEAAPRVYVANEDGSELTALAVGVWPAWSPDGTRIAFSTGTDNWDIYLMNPEGSDLVNLTRSPGTDTRPAWSPDGSMIAFGSTRDGDWEIYVVNADGTGQTRLTHSPGTDDNPTWSPDGRYIAFRSARTGEWDIYIMKADGTEVTQLTASFAQDAAPTWKR